MFTEALFGIVRMKDVQLTPEFVGQHNELLQELAKRKTSSSPGQDREIQELQSQNARLTVEVEQLEAALAAKESVRGQSQNDQEEIKGLKSQLEALQQDSETTHKTLKNAKSKLKATEAELLKVRLERDTSLEEVRTLNTALKALQKRVSDAEGGRPVSNPDGNKSPELKIKFLESEIIEKDEQLRKLMLENALQAMQLSKMRG